jgi:hypothetical protein
MKFQTEKYFPAFADSLGKEHFCLGQKNEEDKRQPMSQCSKTHLFVGG